MRKRDVFTIARPLSIMLLAIIALLVLACSNIASNSSGSTPNSTPSSQKYVSIPIVSTPVPEQAAVPGAVNVYVTLVEFRITSSVKVFHPGIHYYLIVTNRGQDVHEFMMMRDKPDGTPSSFNEDSNGMFIHIEQVFPGTTLRMNFTFSPSLTGKSEIACLMRGHYAAGMRLPIVVTA
jgi:uncharacterized cupredoxin-like copper-binding protein